MRVQCIDLPLDSAPAAGPQNTADEQSISLRCLWEVVIEIVASLMYREVVIEIVAALMYREVVIEIIAALMYREVVIELC